eukprot:COSAG04_NODE_1676_length_5966_cov_34.273734_2_plen_72_part_00
MTRSTMDLTCCCACRGAVFSVDKPESPALEVTAAEPLYVMGVRTLVPTTPGDALLWVGRQISEESLLANDF